MLTSILSTTVARLELATGNKYFVALILIAFLCVDIPLFTANLDKLLSGGWLPLSLGTVMFIRDDHLEERAFPLAAADA